MRALRPTFLALAALLLIVTSQSMAVTRGMMRDASGAMVLCTGSGPITVLFDANGEPIGPSHICPDCAMSVIADAGAAFVLSAPTRRVTALDAAQPAPAFRTADAPRATARGPPVA